FVVECVWCVFVCGDFVGFYFDFWGGWCGEWFVDFVDWWLDVVWFVLVVVVVLVLVVKLVVDGLFLGVCFLAIIEGVNLVDVFGFGCYGVV
ncbi:hypothetical protein G3565_33155, partial [Escherichia coli]|nr:hypothetical protein [Escherichia coli]